MQEHPYGWLSLLPPLVAIALAMVTRRVLASLLVGIFVGAAVLAGGNPIQTVVSAVSDHLWPSLINPDKLHVFAFTMLLGAMIGVISRCGGMQGLVDVVAPLARTRRKGQFTVWLLGLFVFFDDYANTLLLGKTLQPLTDRLKISREKLAYLVDSTAAPVAGLALISTWVAIEIDYINQGLSQLEVATTTQASTLFLASIPYRFYVWGALLFVPIIALSGRDFGPMQSAEQRASQGEPAASESSLELEPVDPTTPEPGTPARWFNAVLPVLVTVTAVIYFLYQSGLDPEQPNQTVQEIIGGADSYTALLWGALLGLLFAAVLVLVQRILPMSEIGNSAWQGALKMTPALAILWLAGALSSITGGDADSADGEAEAQQAIVTDRNDEWAMWTVKQQPPAVWDRATVEQFATRFQDQGVRFETIVNALVSAGAGADLVNSVVGPLAAQAPDTDAYPYRAYRLYTGPFINETLGQQIPLWLMPTIVFVLAGFIAFSTGTSWGTMALVMPLSIPLVVGGIGGSFDGGHPMLLCVIGSVLAGAIFGDHCSPISDTTVLSSQSSGCDHMAHVHTQMPYALCVAMIVILLGTLPVGLGISVWICLPLQLAALVGVAALLGRRPSDDSVL